MKDGSDRTLVYHLRELVAPPDCRVPRVERERERAIGREAQGLRHAALKRIAALERSPSADAIAAVAQETA
jgi:hypothetical protein